MVPSGNTVMESEFHRMAPEGVSIHTSRLHLEATNAEMLAKMATHTERAALELGRAKCDVIVYGCTSGSFIKGLEWEETLKTRIEDISGSKAITTTGALLAAFKCYDQRCISVATPYIEELNLLEEQLFTNCGYQVIKIRGLGLDDNYDMGRVTADKNYRFAKELVTDESEILLISCTDLRTIEIIRPLEMDLGIPVVSSNQVSMWAALRACGIKENLLEYGSLFEY